MPQCIEKCRMLYFNSLRSCLRKSRDLSATDFGISPSRFRHALVPVKYGSVLQLLDLVASFFEQLANVVWPAKMPSPNHNRGRDTALDCAVNLGDPTQVSVIEESQFCAEIKITLALHLRENWS